MARVIDPAAVAANAAAVRERIDRAGGHDVRLVAVTKGLGPDVALAAAEAGLVDLGENYAQELLTKVDAAPGARWHFTGRLQRNKVRLVAEHVHLWHTVDRLELGAEIAKRKQGARVLVQVNTTGEPQKGGCALDAADRLVDELRRLDISVDGLMAVGPAGDPEAAREGFRALRHLAERLELAELSMGMSADLEVAVQEGATIVRVGTDIFGPRPAR